MKKTLLKAKGLFLLFGLVGMGLASCGASSDAPTNQSQEETSQLEQEERNEDIYAIYLLYVDDAKAKGNTPLSYEEWLESIRGEKGDDGLTPYIGKNGNWWIGDTDTGVRAAGLDGKDGVDGLTPYIGENGNWWIGDTDTGVRATGTGEEEEHVHQYSEWIVGEEATCTSMGYDYRVCELCGDVDYRFHEALGHQLEAEPWFVQRPTRTSYGYAIYRCERCGENVIVRLDPVIESDLAFELNASGDSYSVVGIGDCLDTEIVIPDFYDGLPVTQVGANAFDNNDEIVSVYVADSVEYIGDRAFASCDALQTVSLECHDQLGLDVFRDSLNVEVNYRHHLVYVEAKEPTCTESGNIAYYVCEHCGYYFSDPEGQNRIYDVTLPPAHHFEDGVCTECGATAEAFTIVEVDEVGHLGNFPVGTMEDNIGLPPEINARTADGLLHALPVQWDLSSYNRSVAGDYQLIGHIQPGDFYFANEELRYVTASITLTEALIGTADIVFVLDISGSMGDEVNSVKNNLVTLAGMIEERGVSARYGLVTYSDFTMRTDPSYSDRWTEQEDTTVIRNGASDWFTSASSAADAINNIALAYGGDTPEAAVDGLACAYHELSVRRDARVFYVLLTDATYKVNNNYGYETLADLTTALANAGVCVSVIASTDVYKDYNDLVTRTGGMITSITGAFQNALYNYLIPIIYSAVSGGEETPEDGDAYTISLNADGTYGWAYAAGVYTPRNSGHDSSTASMTLTFTQSGTFAFSYLVSSESGCDIFCVYLNGSENMSRSGTVSMTATSITVQAGDVIQFTYRKDSSVHLNRDTVELSSFSFAS